MGDAKLLVATEDFSVSNMVRGALNDKGYSFISASKGDSAIALFKGETPAMVILDTAIKDCDALSVMREIIRVSNIPVICISKDADVVDKVLHMEIGADDFITIPFDSREFAVRVKAANNYHFCSSRVNVADIWRERACILSVEVSQRFH